MEQSKSSHFEPKRVVKGVTKEAIDCEADVEEVVECKADQYNEDYYWLFF